MGQPDQAVRFKQSRQLPFPLLSDPTQKAYFALGLGRVNMMSEFMSGSAISALQEAAMGNVAGVPVGDITQLGGTFLIDQQGIARFVYRDPASNMYPAIKEVMAAVEKLAPVKQDITPN